MVRILLGKLIAAGSYDAPSLLLHRFSFPSGGGFHKGDHGEDFLTPTDASSLSDQIRETICQSVTEGRWRAEVRTGWPLIVASGHSQWNDSRERLTEELARDEHALRAWTILLYVGMRGEKKRIDRIVDAEVVGEKLRSTTPSLWSSPAAAYALRNALEGLRV
ncbi:hypothetical protein [Azospirillum doebereinerae]|uniref:Uncharacterized protein n=1 Tax=Azospirillum doebereinerae TaxID=92933 RepID=A0A3S0WUS6_9PROT|nr:hypothetical protein [Azospirillum doebereinerae]RUQ61402.1 hypothetical protein EJ913_29710 [Azospirillum doebereinerae]